MVGADNGGGAGVGINKQKEAPKTLSWLAYLVSRNLFLAA